MSVTDYLKDTDYRYWLSQWKVSNTNVTFRRGYSIWLEIERETLLFKQFACDR